MLSKSKRLNAEHPLKGRQEKQKKKTLKNLGNVEGGGGDLGI